MEDKRLLIMAAKAINCGIEIPDDGVFVLNGRQWNPLNDDGDALRLAVALRIAIWIGPNGTSTDSLDPLWSSAEEDCALGSDDKVIAATARRAIVRAAAGMAIPEGKTS